MVCQQLPCYFYIQAYCASMKQKQSFLFDHFLIPQFLGLLARSHLSQLVLQMLNLGLQLFLVASNLVLFCPDHHQGLEFLLLPVGGSSRFVLRLVLELLLVLLHSLLIGFQLCLGVLVVRDLVSLDETMWVVLLLGLFFHFFGRGLLGCCLLCGLFILSLFLDLLGLAVLGRAFFLVFLLLVLFIVGDLELLLVAAPFNHTFLGLFLHGLSLFIFSLNLHSFLIFILILSFLTLYFFVISFVKVILDFKFLIITVFILIFSLPILLLFILSLLLFFIVDLVVNNLPEVLLLLFLLHNLLHLLEIFISQYPIHLDRHISIMLQVLNPRNPGTRLLGCIFLLLCAHSILASKLFAEEVAVVFPDEVDD